jgi:ERCC4-type nuclease
MDARVVKLKHYVDAGVAEALVTAGLDSPRKIKAADDKDIEKIKGIGKAKRDKIRKRIPKYKE